MAEQENPSQPELIDPEGVKVTLVIDEECTPCAQIRKHLEQYGGEYEVIDPLSAEAERFWDENQVKFPTAVITRENGTEVPCEIFMDEENLVLKCDDGLLVVKEPSPELLESLPQAEVIQPRSPADLPRAP
ncbi:hypothetical protein LCGC14_1615100 [marine sediment metagenome]|uniref:Glutaredoxin domain-containing protein n=1 Tax=marine sediment metagenome TaxID=412755 RepID=A0A0F9KMN2_9ZZZZ